MAHPFEIDRKSPMTARRRRLRMPRSIKFPRLPSWKSAALGVMG